MGARGQTGGLTRGQSGVVAVGQVAKVRSEALPWWRKRKTSDKGSVKEEERGRVSLLGNGPSPAPPGAMLTSSAGTADLQSSMRLLWAKACESPRGACVSTPLPSWPTDSLCRHPLLHEVRGGDLGGELRRPNPADEWCEGWHTAAGHSRNRADGTHACARCSASVSAEILTCNLSAVLAKFVWGY